MRIGSHLSMNSETRKYKKKLNNLKVKKNNLEVFWAMQNSFLSIILSLIYLSLQTFVVTGF